MSKLLPASRQGRIGVAVTAVAVIAAVVVIAARGGAPDSVAAVKESAKEAAKEAAKKAAARPALTVSTVAPQRADWPNTLPANGNVTAWQEAVIGAELAGLRVTDVQVNVGDTVRRGQVLARLADEAVVADLAQARASAVEAEASLAEARANAERSKQLQSQGFISPQATVQVVTAEQTAAARLAAARARVQAENVKLAHTKVLAPDDGVISARGATVGSLTQPGQELFRLIRGSRLEWRAEVTSAELAKLAPGLTARLTTPGGERISGTVRAVAPSVDPATRNGIVYVDIPAGSPARAGTFARGEFELGNAPALTLPQSAVLLRDGFAYVFSVGADQRVEQVKVDIGRRVGERVEVRDGLDATARVVETGAGFLADGDTVRVVERGLPADAPVKAAAK